MNINDIRQAAFRGNEEATPENKFLEGAAEWASDYFGNGTDIQAEAQDEFLSNIQQRAFGGQGVEEYANLSRPTEFDSSSFAPMESLEDEFIGPDFTEYQHGQVNQTDYTGAVYPGYDDARHDWHWVQENVPESEWVNWGPTEGDKTLDQLTSEDWEAGHHDLSLQQKEQTSGFISEAQASDANGGEGKWHVQKGDTLTSIANTLGTSVPALLKANPDIKDQNNISVGQKLNMYGPNMVESEGGEEYGDINNIKEEAQESVKASGDIGSADPSEPYAAHLRSYKPIVDQYAENLKEYEGSYSNTSFAHKPTSGSGVTVAQGLDSAWETREEMEALGVPARVLDYMESIHAWRDGTAAVLTDARKNPENSMNREEFAIVSTNLANRSRDDAIKFKKDYLNLNTKGISILMSLNHWGGGWNQTEESKLTRWSDNIDTGNAVTTGTLVSPIKEALSNPDVTNAELAEALDTIRKSYVPWGPGRESHRYKTLSKYIKRLEE